MEFSPGEDIRSDCFRAKRKQFEQTRWKCFIHNIKESKATLYTPLAESIDPPDYEWKVICVQGQSGLLEPGPGIYDEMINNERERERNETERDGEIKSQRQT